MAERPIVPVGVLTYKRAGLLSKTLQSFFEHNMAYLSRFPIVAFVQGWDEDTLAVLRQYDMLIDEVMISNRNIGAANGMLSVLTRCRERYQSKYVMMLEDDWESRDCLGDYLDDILKFLDESEQTGYIRLRATHQRVFNKNRMTRQGIKYIPVNDLIYRGNMHFTTNPTILKTYILEHFEQWGLKKEYQMIEVCHNLGLCGAQLRKDIFWHIGLKVRTHPWIG